MSEKVVVLTDQAPAPLGPYSQGIKWGNTFFIAGQIAIDPTTGKLVGDNAASQTEQIMKSIDAILSFAGLTMGHIVRCVVYVVDLNDMTAINEAYAGHFVYEPPARTTVQVAALPGGALVEIEATAMMSAHPS